ncbi:MAG: GGDEF domain-containing protein [Vicinamibacterales bacterium]
MPPPITELALSRSPRDRAEVLFGLSDRLLDLVADHAPDDALLQVDSFKQRIDAWRRDLKHEPDPARLAQLVADAADDVAGFLDRARGYRADREAELIDLVELLRTVLEAVRGESQQFENELARSTAALGRMVEIEDLRELKRVLKQEVEVLREAVAEHRATEARRFESLTSRVQTLEQSLVKARAAAATDALTNLPNRGAFDVEIREWIARAARDGRAFSVGMVDLDDFKRINDTYGHPVGDRVIVAAARILRDAVGDGELVARFGGEEFALLLSSPTAAKARQRVSAMLDLVPEVYEYEHDGKKGRISFTFSGGVASWVAGDTADSIVKRADEALYDAKRRGKRRVEARPQALLRSLIG